MTRQIHEESLSRIVDLYPPALEVSHHVSALRNLGGSVQAHVGVLTINHVLLGRRDTIM